MSNINFLRKQLYASIDELIDDFKPYLTDDKDYFSKDSKLPIRKLIEFILFMGADAIKDELYEFFDFKDTPTTSAFVQQRQKLKFEAFKFLFESFNKKVRSTRNVLYKGYRLLAVDGSSILISHNPNDIETYIKKYDKYGQVCKGYNAFHMTAMYDLMSHLYDDVVIHGEQNVNEHGAFKDMVNRYEGVKAIFICDRGFESLNSFVHVMKKEQKFLIRVKDIGSNGLLSSFPEQETEEFDIDYQFIATTKQTNEVKKHKEIYKFMSNCSTFDHFEEGNPYYPVNIRIVRIKIGEIKYESVITNLDRNEFTFNEIKWLYGIRWGIETSFRELKYAVGLSAFHAKNRNSIKQEIYAKLLFYNFSEKLIRSIKPRKAKKERIHIYAINSTRAFHNIRIYLKKKRGGKRPPDIESIIANEIEPIRPGRSDPRKVRKQAPVHFIYRFQ